MEHYGYIYRITVNNEESHLHGCTYVGQHKYCNKNTLDSKYFGSSARIKNEYIPKYGYKGLEIKGIIWADSKERLNELEVLFILIEKRINGDKCLNKFLRVFNHSVSFDQLPEAIRLERSKHRSEISKQVWSDSDRRQKISIKRKEFLSNKEERKKLSEAIIESLKDPKKREKISKASKDKKWFNNGNINIRSKEKPEGDEWVEGKLSDYVFTEEHKINLSLAHQDLHWYNNGEVNTRAYEKPQGFKEGMLPMSDERKQQLSESSKGFIWITNGIEEEKYRGDTNNLPKGYHQGRLKEVYNDDLRRKISESMTDRKWYNNGEKSICIHDYDPIPEGFVPGMLITENMEKRGKRKWFTDGKNELMCLEEECPDGYTRGRLKRKKS